MGKEDDLYEYWFPPELLFEEEFLQCKLKEV